MRFMLLLSILSQHWHPGYICPSHSLCTDASLHRGVCYPHKYLHIFQGSNHQVINFIDWLSSTHRYYSMEFPCTVKYWLLTNKMSVLNFLQVPRCTNNQTDLLFVLIPPSDIGFLVLVLLCGLGAVLPGPVTTGFNLFFSTASIKMCPRTAESRLSVHSVCTLIECHHLRPQHLHQSSCRRCFCTGRETGGSNLKL